MKILAHRGCWKTEEEKNSLISIKRAFMKGFGIETDIRDRNGELVVSHNPADVNAPLFSDVLKLWMQSETHPLLALNIKADGLYLGLGGVLKEYSVRENDYFLFDASVPEQYVYIKRGYNIFTRSSEFEEKPSFWEQSKGVWLDQFTDCDHIKAVLPFFLESSKMIVVVSPELHGRDAGEIWKFLHRYVSSDNLVLCTDVPEEAARYFYG